MWYWHQMWSGTFIVGIAGNIVAALIGFAVGLMVAHKVYDLRALHRAVRERTERHREKL